jgi:hypothetical protein
LRQAVKAGTAWAEGKHGWREALPGPALGTDDGVSSALASRLCTHPGISPEIVAQPLGHADVTVTLIYGE